MRGASRRIDLASTAGLREAAASDDKRGVFDRRAARAVDETRVFVDRGAWVLRVEATLKRSPYE